MKLRYGLLIQAICRVSRCMRFTNTLFWDDCCSRDIVDVTNLEYFLVVEQSASQPPPYRGCLDVETDLETASATCGPVPTRSLGIMSGASDALDEAWGNDWDELIVRLRGKSGPRPNDEFSIQQCAAVIVRLRARRRKTFWVYRKALSRVSKPSAKRWQTKSFHSSTSPKKPKSRCSHPPVS